MKTIVLAVLVATTGCSDAPVEITSPSAGQVFIGPGFVELRVLVRDRSATDLTVEVDGEPAPFEVFLPPDLGACDECTFVARLSAFEMAPGTRVISVEASGTSGRIGRDEIEVELDGTPEIRRIAPVDVSDLRGVGTLTLVYEVFAREPVALEIAPDGILAAATEPAACRAGCRLEHVWMIASAGRHDVVLTSIIDGVRAEQRESFLIQDAVRVAAISVRNAIDQGFTNLDLEVYLFEDATDRFLGCAGNGSGLEKAQRSNMRYEVNADLIAPGGALLDAWSLPTTPLRFEVWENDDNTGCPQLPNTGSQTQELDDLMGTSPALTSGQWTAQTAPISFGDVTTFEVVVGRPLVR